nr:RNA-directed DNA polymerase, eukaryota, reverse transcriptase zinc-binding domain protein [Tanacetum cinerariifolium]
MLAPKEKGGLGVSSLYALNRGLMFKWMWRFYTQNTSLWVRVIKAIHGDDEKVGGYVKDGAKSSWLSIVNEINSLKNKGINLLDFMHVKLGNGDKTAFWEDIWIEGKALKNRYPCIYSLKTCKLITVGMKLAQTSLDSSFRRVPRGGVEQEQFDELSALVHDVTLTPMSDRWIWTLESSGDFSVASVRKEDLCARVRVSGGGGGVGTVGGGGGSGAESSVEKEVAEVFVEAVVKHHGIPKTIVCDRDPIFVSKFWTQLFKLSGTQLNRSTTYHPQTEVVNHRLEQGAM